MNDRIKLAEAMGWKKHHSEEWWAAPEIGMFKPAESLPDPLTDANNCEALIRHMNGLGHYINIDHDCDGSAHMILGKGEKYRDHEWQGHDWKQGVCELALKALT